MQTSSSAIYTEQLSGNIPLEMIRVEGGTFEMGSNSYSAETPVHSVQLDSFCMGKYPVTQAQWQAVMGVNPSYFRGADRPVERVSWRDTQDFLQKLNQNAAQVYRLPTEAEWEFAARGGNLSKDYRYAGSHDLKDVGWYEDNSHGETKAVGQKFPNELDLYDMNGNILEWCQDGYREDYYQQCADQGLVVNPQGPKRESGRLIRGGSWRNHPHRCRSLFRDWYLPQFASIDLGFRLVFSLSR